ncbi:SDR family NAD(P)-dependent oxidoreductase [Streptococcus chenjunshii]|uniref:SDR family NAD(P)-dependent oxidoreductase n=1 Tax=Streptococcus chenjunshii TaxID=2173853 RepID=A0A372KLX7_9STRE|nr:SDR family NAD(P)-dependent oxidoreductase [Streptococcus chenjunshii]AXQ79191.1 SDR family NAD(P)-dependent oxidoreductase [Streptococcus chenjunshii]RFU50763.1 SDR family NAD(P)-dependent oxidoreductase [Streptococcus chenjunshii]RFU52944.1 SDR family NAD(P)-dependent oxidoreductase [Streptococcus chenjunshii]
MRALLTGASSGIGREMAYLLAEKQVNLILTARRQPALQRLQKDLIQTYQIDCQIIIADLSDPAELSALTDFNIDLLINCAGRGEIADALNVSAANDEQMLQLNFLSPLSLTKFFCRKWLAAGQQGRVITVCSLAARLPHPYMAMYSASKAAMLSYSLSLSQELRKSGVIVQTVCLGPVATAFLSSDQAEKGGQLSPKSAAQKILSVCRHKRPLAVFGLGSRILNCLFKILPIRVSLFLTAAILNRIRS